MPELPCVKHNKRHNREELLNDIHLNGSNLGFHLKLETTLYNVKSSPIIDDYNKGPWDNPLNWFMVYRQMMK